MQAFLLLAVVASAVAALFDLRTREIPNWVSLGTLVVGIAAHVGYGAARVDGMAGLRAGGMALVGALACGLVPFVFWQKGAFGGGDVKMMAAVGACLMPLDGIEAEFYALICAAVVAPAQLAWEGKLLKTLGNVATIVLNPLRPKAKRKEVPVEAMTQLRFGPAIFVGALLCAVVHWRDRL
ncbi:MAG TPA: A24 family peptidase [Polyangiaceae bacterium]|jgi:prepilin peptidase CpaA